MIALVLVFALTQVAIVHDCCCVACECAEDAGCTHISPGDGISDAAPVAPELVAVPARAVDVAPLMAALVEDIRALDTGPPFEARPHVVPLRL